VTISSGFWIGQTDVTQEAYQRVTGADPSRFKGPRLPVDQVNWDDAGKYCQATGMRLPTEAEWEYAARAGTAANRYGDLDRIAWYDSNSDKRTHDVGQKEPNAWGLYDMLGNVSQWTSDLYTDSYGASTGPDSVKSRAVRGGSWSQIPLLVTASYRLKGAPRGRNDFIGVRCAGD
jgi:formylglycine-generating enzyme required for sulfatase activity